MWRLAVLKSRSDSQNGPPLFKWKCALTRTTSDNRVVCVSRWMHLRLSGPLTQENYEQLRAGNDFACEGEADLRSTSKQFFHSNPLFAQRSIHELITSSPIVPAPIFIFSIIHMYRIGLHVMNPRH